ncbi:MAG TPA: hypothetical protein VFK69_00460, partial [Candidatus Eisenbacteria bacterium]|nr:hypothetical protein [Candidatus Eisenbacteria bacterium]
MSPPGARLPRLAAWAVALASVTLGARLPGIAGQAALHPALALAPGMALACWVAEPGVPALLLGWAIGPLVACV